MRAELKEYQAVEAAAMKFVKSVAEGNSAYAKELFIDEAVLFGYLDGKLEHGSIEQFYHKWKMVCEVLIPGVLNVGDIDKTDGCKKAAALADEI